MSENPIFYSLKKQDKYSERLQDAHVLFKRLVVSSGVGFLACGLLMLLFTGPESQIPLILMIGSLLIGLNHLGYLKFKKLQLSTLIFSSLVWLCCVISALFSHGPNSPFLWLLMIYIFVAWATFKPIGIGMLAASGLVVGLMFTGVFFGSNSPGYLPSEADQTVLRLLIFALSGIVLVGVFGPYIYAVHQRLYTEKLDVQKRLNEKEMLLKEVHHRVKNNLQTVSSLLRMQGRNLETGESLNVIQSSQNRVVAMAMVHEMLYMREDLAKIDYRTYVTELGGYLIKSIKGPESKISLRIDIPEIELGIDTAIPLGLLINEAVTNALKYGFRDRENGEISILLERENKTEFVLRIGDNGIGYPENISYKTTKSLGLKLIHNLSRQLQGTVMRDLSKEGTNYIIRFHELNPSSFHSLA